MSILALSSACSFLCSAIILFSNNIHAGPEVTPTVGKAGWVVACCGFRDHGRERGKYHENKKTLHLQKQNRIT